MPHNRNQACVRALLPHALRIQVPRLRCCELRLVSPRRKRNAPVWPSCQCFAGRMPHPCEQRQHGRSQMTWLREDNMTGHPQISRYRSCHTGYPPAGQTCRWERFRFSVPRPRVPSAAAEARRPRPRREGKVRGRLDRGKLRRTGREEPAVGPTFVSPAGNTRIPEAPYIRVSQK